MTVRYANLGRLVEGGLGTPAAAEMLGVLEIDARFATERAEVGRAELAMALNILLFADLLDRMPAAAGYVADRRARGERVTFDHGALRTIRFADGPTGALPAGTAAFARLLGPLGYAHVRDYPLPALGMTGQAWCHRDLPETLPQFFVSELHVDRFSPAFGDAAARVFGTSHDPLDAAASAGLARLAEDKAIPFAVAAAMLPTLAAAFDRQHAVPAQADYETLLAESAEAAWIATEGNAFNHATDRVPDVDALAAALRDKGLDMKPAVEVSTSGRVRQTALRAAPVERSFTDGATTIARTVPGSFYEFITRDVDPASGTLDLSFDSGNAQGIFAMTKVA